MLRFPGAKTLTGRKLFFRLAALALLAPAIQAAAAPRVFLLSRSGVAALERELRRPRREWTPGLAAFASRLQARAGKALAAGPFSVMQKSMTPPSGSKHDYMSWAPYFWPNPHTSNGLPYIRRDGRRNPQIRKITDHDQLHQLIPDAEILALAYYLTGREAYAAHAAALIRAWFLAPATRMNPNLNYAQGIPGRVTGRGIGIIDTAGFPHLIDALGLLRGSPAWTGADQAGMQAWFRRYLDWLRHSRNGRAERASANNHGTYYDLQAAVEAMFTRQPALARRILLNARRRIARQILPSGREPLETARTQSMQYSIMNLRGLFSLAWLGRHAGVQLWSYRTPRGAGLEPALDYLLPYALKRKPWPYPEITRWSPRGLAPALYLAMRQYAARRGAYRAALRRIEPQYRQDEWLRAGWRN